jgi:hypothetical protein
MADKDTGQAAVSSTPYKPGDTPIAGKGQAFPIYATQRVKDRRKLNRAALGLPAEDDTPITKPATTRSLSKR